jgi:hypothetical protein
VFGLICIWVLLACISKKSTLIFVNSEKLQQSIELRGQSYKGGLWFFVRLFKIVNGGSGCVVFLFFCFIKWSDGVRNTGLCDLSGLKDLRHQM